MDDVYEYYEEYETYRQQIAERLSKALTEGYVNDTPTIEDYVKMLQSQINRLHPTVEWEVSIDPDEPTKVNVRPKIRQIVVTFNVPKKGEEDETRDSE